MKLRTLFYLYGWRLRAHPFQEVLAGAGIAAGVALLFAVQVANTSVTGSVGTLLTGIVGSADIQVTAGDAEGFGAETVEAVRAVRSVDVAAPVLERRATLAGPRGSRPFELFGIERSLAALGGSLTRNFGASGLSLPARGLVLPSEIARAVGVGAGHIATVKIAGRAVRVRVAATLGVDQVGDVSRSPLAVATLSYAQEISGMPGQVTSIFVRSKAGAADEARQALRKLAGGRFDVSDADAMVRRLDLATKANDQSTALFSAISALVAVLFAFNAMLLTVPDRRRFVAELRTQGATVGQVITVVGSQALVLGAVASTAGLLVGDALSRAVFNGVPGYLAFTFPIGTQRVVPVSVIALAFAAGMVAALAAAGRPLLDAFARNNLEAVYDEDGEPGEGISYRQRIVLLAIAVGLMIATAIGVAIEPSAAVVGVLVLIVAALAAMPAVFAGCTWVLDRLAEPMNLKLLMIAVMSARASTTRSVAVASIAAVAVIGNVAIGGARNDLVRGLQAGYADHLGTADVWITTAGRSLTTDPFRISSATLQRLRNAPGVDAVRLYQGGMFDTGSRRIWVIARPRGDSTIVPASQVVDGDAAVASEQIRRGGAVAVSAVIARSRGVGVGDHITLPAPAGPLNLRVAAIVTNLSWGPGAVILNADDYRRAWGTADPSAIEIDVSAGTAMATARHTITDVFGKQAAALDIQTRQELLVEFDGLLDQGLTRLTQISAVLLIASALALAVAMSASVWDRRRLLAAYKLEGIRKWQIGGMLLYEGATVLTIGCAVGLAVGVFGHLLGNRWLELTTGYPAPFSIQIGHMVTLVAIVLALSLAIVALPGYLAARVPPRLRFEE
jgi:putative ABC transport system permease protein